jgi:two-component system chemotaxis response regulator CheB
MPSRDLIVVGASAGGVEALQVLLRGLPADLPAAILIVTHTMPRGPYLLPEILSRVTSLPVVKPHEDTRIEPGKIYVAPPDHHLLVQESRLRLSKGPKENRSRPAIDPLFRTAAAAYGPRVIAVVLTGMLDDGTAGASAVRERGGTVVVQDPADALYPSMPASALRYVGADYVSPLANIAALLGGLVREAVDFPPERPKSATNDIESRFLEMKNMNIADMDAIGARSGVSCPECHGPIWKIKDGAVQRYRCHVGHAYTAMTMLEGQADVQETHLWQAMRLMTDRVSLMLELRSHAQHEGRTEEAASFDAHVKRLQKHIESIRDILSEEDPAPPPDRPA